MPTPAFGRTSRTGQTRARSFRGASPLRKLRWGDRRRGKGKRGGLRVIYIHIPDLHVLFMLDVYGKDEADDLTTDEKRVLQGLAKQLVEELHKRNDRGRR